MLCCSSLENALGDRDRWQASAPTCEQIESAARPPAPTPQHTKCESSALWIPQLRLRHRSPVLTVPRTRLCCAYREQACNYDDVNVGFPRDCGPMGLAEHQWNSWARLESPDVAFFIDAVRLVNGVAIDHVVLPEWIGIEDTSTWADAAQRCENLGKRLCTLAEYCPFSAADGRHVFGGRRGPGNQWAPIADSMNDWVSIGTGTYAAVPQPDKQTDTHTPTTDFHQSPA